MILIPLSLDHVPFGKPLDFSLRTSSGLLLAQKGYVVRSRAELEAICGHGGLHVDAAESREHQRAFAEHLHGMVNHEAALGQIAQAKIETVELHAATTDDGRQDWYLLQSQANSCLLAIGKADFAARFERLFTKFENLVGQKSGAVLFALMVMATTDTRLYSATHALLVSAMCQITSREVLRWPAAQVSCLGRSALSMNVSITELQDVLATQAKPPSPEQRVPLESHASDSFGLLQRASISDEDWLDAVRFHHDAVPGPLHTRTRAEQMARLIQRADVYAACLSPRAYRAPLPTLSVQSRNTALQACYFDEDRQVDEAGASLIKAIGVYPPGSIVRLASQELAIVLRRGANAAAPKVAVLVNRSGMAVADPVIRLTDPSEFRVVGCAAPGELKVQVNLERLIAFV